ncbi:MAG: zinc ribbon domain-containing protein [Thaumarchaeota archaeon]|nr:zinc ribbon domain-containing protein [Nitrososphaerota archaeon]
MQPIPIPPGPSCQSCGMPMSRDANGGGTEMDGSTKSIEYCSNCYRDGRFTEPDLTVDQMIAKVQARLQSAGMPEPVIERNLMAVYGLDRWKED